MPVSSSTVATQIAFEPDIGGVSSGSMMMKPIAASGRFGGTSRLTWRKTPPRGSFSRKSRKRAVAGDPARLLPERGAGRRRDAADDDVADLALGMAADDVDDALLRMPGLPDGCRAPPKEIDAVRRRPAVARPGRGTQRPQRDRLADPTERLGGLGALEQLRVIVGRDENRPDAVPLENLDCGADAVAIRPAA